MNATKPTGLIETMRMEEREIALLDAHLERLRRSAKALGFECPVEAVRACLREKRAEMPEGVVRVRLILEMSGEFSISWTTLGDSLFETATVYPFPVEEAGTAECVYKTTTRNHYDRAQRWATENGADEAILINPDGQIFDATRATVWAEKEGMMVTPPLDSGGLPGVMRRCLLTERDNTSEQMLSPEDLTSADRVYLSNAVRGLMRVQLL